MGNKFMIPEGSIVHFELHGVGSNDVIKKAEVYKDMEVINDAILIIDNGLYCTDSIMPVEEMNDNEFKINVWLQDAFVVKDNYFYESLSKAN